MHILFLVNHYPPGPPIGGIVTYTRLMAGAWKQAGHQVSVVCQSQNRLRYEENQEGIRVVRVPSRSYPGALWDKIWFRLMGDNSQRLLHHREFSFAILREVESWGGKPDLVESPEAFAWGWHLQRAGYPVVVRVHGPNRLAREADPAQSLLKARCLEEAEWEFLRDARGVFPMTGYMKGVIEGWGLRVAGVIPLSMTIDEGALASQTPKGWRCAPTGEKSKKLIAVGRVIAGKGFDTAIRAVAALGEPWKLEIVGPEGAPDAVQSLKTLARDLGAETRVTFTGALTHEETLQCMARATALIHDSLNDNMPYVILEAMALGTPVLASRVGGIPETVGAHGYLFDPGDVAGYVETLKALPAAPDIAVSAIVKKRHDPARIQMMCEEAYKGALPCAPTEKS